MKRNNFRTLVTAKAKITLIDREEFRQATSSHRLKELGSSLSTGDAKSDLALSSLADYLVQIDEKLDLILDKLEGRELNPAKKEIQVRQTNDISGSGVSLVLNQPVETGQLLRMAMILPGFTLGRFEAYGEVVRVAPTDQDGQIAYNVGIKFLNLSEEEKEHLISYTFSEQRKQIRASNGS